MIFAFRSRDMVHIKISHGVMENYPVFSRFLKIFFIRHDA